MHAEDYSPETTVVIAILIFILAFLGGCATPHPEPVIIERKCSFAELRDKSELPAVEFIRPPECPYYRCLDKENAKLLQAREAALRGDSNYARMLYLDTKRRCE